MAGATASEVIGGVEAAPRGPRPGAGPSPPAPDDGPRPEPGGVRVRAGRWWRHVDWRYQGGYALALAAVIVLALTPLGRHAGWPLGQTYGQGVFLAQMYAAHFRHGDLFPVWSSSDAYGMGSPVLLYYQRAFFAVAGLLLVLTGGSIKVSLTLTLALFMVVGAYGMLRALGLVTGRKPLLVIGSLGYLFTNYAFSDWLIRGDLGEFSAMMTVPWLVHWCLLLVRNRRVSWEIVPVMVVLVDAHNAVALLSLLLLAVTAVTFAVTAGWAGIRARLGRLVGVTLVTAVLLGPLALAEYRMNRYYDPAVKVTHYSGAISANFVDPLWYLVDPGYHWFTPPAGQPVLVQLDYGLWIPVVLGLVVGAVVLVRRGAPRRRDRRRPAPAPPPAGTVHGPTLVVLLGSSAVYLLLQLRGSLFVYDRLVPVLKVISPPYRMLSLVTPMLLVVVVVFADAALARGEVRHRRATHGLAWGAAAVWIAALVVQSPLTSSLPPARIAPVRTVPTRITWTFAPIPALTEPKAASFATLPDGALFQEYLPVVRHHGTEVYDDSSQYAALHAAGTEAQSLSDVPCTVTEPSGTAWESLEQHYTVTCAGPTRLALPISYNPFTTVDRTVAGRTRAVPTLHVTSDPRVVIEAAGPGTEQLTVHLPTLWSVLG